MFDEWQLSEDTLPMDMRNLVSNAPHLLYRVVDSQNNTPDGDGHFLSRGARSHIDLSTMLKNDIPNRVVDWECVDSPFLSSTSDPLWAIWKAGRRLIAEERQEFGSSDTESNIRILIVNLCRDNTLRRAVFDLTQDALQRLIKEQGARQWAHRWAFTASEVLIPLTILASDVASVVAYSEVLKFRPSFLCIPVDGMTAETWEWECAAEFAQDGDALASLAVFVANIYFGGLGRLPMWRRTPDGGQLWSFAEKCLTRLKPRADVWDKLELKLRVQAISKAYIGTLESYQSLPVSADADVLEVAIISDVISGLSSLKVS